MLSKDARDNFENTCKNLFRIKKVRKGGVPLMLYGVVVSSYIYQKSLFVKYDVDSNTGNTKGMLSYF